MISIKGGWLNRIKIWDEWEKSRAAFIKKHKPDFFDFSATLRDKKATLKDKTKSLTKGLKTVKAKWVLINIADWFLDGTQVGTFLFIFIMAAVQPDLSIALWSGFAWWFWSAASMGEVAGGVGDTTEAWGENIAFMKRSSAIKKALFHGLAGGALLTLATGWLWWIPVIGSFPVVYFIGNTINRKVMKERGWAISELLYDVVIFTALGAHVWLN